MPSRRPNHIDKYYKHLHSQIGIHANVVAQDLAPFAQAAAHSLSKPNVALRPSRLA